MADDMSKRPTIAIYGEIGHSDMRAALEGAEALGFRPLVRNPKYWNGACDMEPVSKVWVLAGSPNAPRLLSDYNEKALREIPAEMFGVDSIARVRPSPDATEGPQTPDPPEDDIDHAAGPKTPPDVLHCAPGADPEPENTTQGPVAPLNPSKDALDCAPIGVVADALWGFARRAGTKKAALQQAIVLDGIESVLEKLGITRDKAIDLLRKATE